MADEKSGRQSRAFLEAFLNQAAKVGATGEIVSSATEAVRAVADTADRLRARVVTATSDGALFAPPGAIVGGSVADVTDADLGVSLAHLGVAETGSVLLGANAAPERLVGMLCRCHVVVLLPGRVVATLDDAATELRRFATPGGEQLRYLSLVTGPSRTADIERVLTVGVQGPAALHIIAIAEAV